MANKGIVNIHGRNYMTVARRLELAHENNALESVSTDVLNHNPVVVKATLKINGQEYTGISAVDLNSNRLIEKENPYEVAETSAVGRALGFAGYGSDDSVASADEMIRATSPRQYQNTNPQNKKPLPSSGENRNPVTSKMNIPPEPEWLKDE